MWRLMAWNNGGVAVSARRMGGKLQWLGGASRVEGRESKSQLVTMHRRWLVYEYICDLGH